MVSKFRKTNEQKEEERKNKELLAKRAKRDSQILDRTFSTDSGKRALKIIMDRCCYQKPVSALDSNGALSENNMIHNGAMQGFYLWLRKNINSKTLSIIENEGIQEDILD